MPLDADNLSDESRLAQARAAIAPLYRIDETKALVPLVEAARLSSETRGEVARQAARLLDELRAPGRAGWTDRFLREYSLSSEEGAALLGLAEAYLRIPDAGAADALIRDKLARGDWRAHLGSADSFLVNSATLGLIMGQALSEASESGGALRGAIARLGEPAVRTAVAAAMQTMGEAFVLGRDIHEALRRADRRANRSFRYSFDMLGEAARTAADADAYLESYRTALIAVGEAAEVDQDVSGRDGVSVKLSALYSRYEPFHASAAVPALMGRLIELARLAKDVGVGLTVDAEESERLEMSLDIIQGAARDPSLAGWDGLGLAVQAYQRRAPAVVAWAGALARATRRRLMVRLVKGAYWDTEIKRAQERGLADYPVFTRKAYTDVSYLACAKAMLAEEGLYPAFATHNAVTVATVLQWAGNERAFEFQRLHGMGEGLYEDLMASLGIAVRVYAPVGGYRDLLAYLVRRLLENGANSSFVHRITDRRRSDDELLADPVLEAERRGLSSHPAIPKPGDLFAPERRNSAGLDLSDDGVVRRLQVEMAAVWARTASAAPIVSGIEARGPARPVLDPADTSRVVGQVIETDAATLDRALATAQAAQPGWNANGPGARAAILERLADLIETDRAALMALAIREAGKTIADAHGEVREAADFCRYYAAQARKTLAPLRLPGPTGETNELTLSGRGVFACISPWNFPLAIFIGQVAAALAAGNAVIAKPAPQTPLIAAAAVRLALRAGVPPEIVHLAPGGPDIGAALIADRRVAGVAFTGSTASARKIARGLLEDEGRPLVPLIAETGGVNAMIVDSTALAEQVVADVITSAFLSAGQRCSALRLLLLQEDVAEPMLKMLTGAMAELTIGDPAAVETDVGPLIDRAAKEAVERHVASHEASVLYRTPLPAGLERGWFVAPTVISLGGIGDLKTEVFGPVLHVATWKGSRLAETVEAVMASGYGLTLGVHSRIGAAAQAVRARARVGNLYVNRSMIGAVVGVQPFGGEGLSGTGPKGGGPHYLPRFTVERTCTVDTTSAGGNASLLSLEE
jgi:RHH-type proline utilization regulon transcriptional repressor/proline dehydrogenase/delta 1-pyrroline-5-carboxylate dehydrogenase